jgi:hypothetical protein
VRLRALATLAAAATLLVGCGSTPSPSLVQLRAQGARICTAAGQRLRLIATPRSEAGGEAFLKQAVAVLAPELRQLRKLRPSSEASDVYGTALDALARELGTLQGTIRALARQQDPVIAFKTLQQHLRPLETQADDAWRALDMTACLER